MGSGRHTTLVRGFAILTSCALLWPLLSSGTAHADGPSFPKPVRAGAGSEPNVTIAPDGTIFVDAPTGTPGHSQLYRQLPGTTSFKALSFPSPYSRFPGGGDSSVALSPGNPNRVYFLDLWLGSNSLTVSDDNGSTWTSGTPLTTLPPSDRQWIATGKRDPVTGNDTVYILYRGPASTWFARSTDSGVTWTHQAFFPGLTPQNVGSAPLIANGDFVATSFINGNQLTIATSNDAGDTWTLSKPQYAKNATGFIANMAVDGQDYWAVYADRTYNIEVVHSPDRGVTWEREGFPTQVNDGGSNIFPWVAARNGKVAVTWYSAPSASGDPNAVDAKWYLMYSEFTGHDEFDNMTFSAPVIAAGPVKSSGGVCTSGIGCTKDRDLGDFQTVAIDANGKSVVAFVSNGSTNVVKQN